MSLSSSPPSLSDPLFLLALFPSPSPHQFSHSCLFGKCSLLFPLLSSLTPPSSFPLLLPPNFRFFSCLVSLLFSSLLSSFLSDSPLPLLALFFPPSPLLIFAFLPLCS